MSDMRVRIEVEIFDELGETMTLIGATRYINASDNPLWFARKFDELVKLVSGDIRGQIAFKHGDLNPAVR